MTDTLKYLNDFQLSSGSLGLDKTYTSISAMNADTEPVSDITGKPLKAGQLAVIVPTAESDPDAGKVYRYNSPGDWTYIQTIGNIIADKELSETSENPIQNSTVTRLVTEYNVSNHFPTDGIDGSNRYTLETAIAKIPASLRTVGIKCSFMNDAGQMETWEYHGGAYLTTASWIRSDISAVNEKIDSQKAEVDAAKNEAMAAIDNREQEALDNFNAQRVTPEMLSEATKQLINSSGGGTINNLPDDEDITSTGGDTPVLKFKDRKPDHGKGYVILRRNKTFAEQVTQANTIYEIRYDFNLDGGTVSLPDNCVLNFKGGLLSNGTLRNCRVFSVTNSQIFSGLQLSDISFISPATPEYFGAAGDDVTDDTEAFRYAIYYSHLLSFRLTCVPQKRYLISGPLNYYNNNYYDVRLNISGELYKTASYNHSEANNTFSIQSDTHMFENGTISGMIKYCRITTRAWGDDDSVIFNNCKLSQFTFDTNSVDRVRAFMRNCNLQAVSYISRSRIVAMYFVEITEDDFVMMDSYIINNYITGLMKLNGANYCFGWNQYNAATIANNFIDYFRAIYAPQLKDTTQSVLSIGNQYQVFRYFYTSENEFTDKSCSIRCYGLGINSINDSFNWLDPIRLEDLKGLESLYKKREYYDTDLHKTNTETYELPPYIFHMDSYTKVLQNAQIEQNISEFIIPNTISLAKVNLKSTISFCRIYGYTAQNDFYFSNEETRLSYYNDYNTPYFGLHHVDGNNYYDELPEIKTTGDGGYSSWCNFPIGFKIVVKQRKYELSILIQGKNPQYFWRQIEDNSVVYRNAEGACKMLNGKPVFWTGEKWVDATGADA